MPNSVEGESVNRWVFNKDKVVKGIYKFDDDKLTLCLAEPGKDRPKAFAGKAGSGHTLLVLLKQKK